MLSYRFLRNSIGVVILAALLCPLSHASAQEIILYTFTGAPGGAWPSGHLTFDKAGNVYGVTSRGGANDSGVVYELTPTGGGWSFQLLHRFARTDGAGSSRSAGLRSAGESLWDNHLWWHLRLRNHL